MEGLYHSPQRVKGIRKPGQFKSIQQVTKSEWSQMYRLQRRELFSGVSIHVMEDSTGSQPPFNKHILTYNLHEFFDVYEARFCHGEQKH